MLWLVEQAVLAPEVGRQYLWVAPVFPQARIAYSRLRQMLPPKLTTFRDSDHSIALFNGSTIWFRSGLNPDNIFGDDIWAAVIDEASRCVAADTLVDTSHGPIPVKQLQVGQRIFNAVGTGTVTHITETRHTTVVNVKVENENLIQCSVDHKFLTQRGWVEARDLTESDYIAQRHETLRVVRQDDDASIACQPPRRRAQVLLKKLLSRRYSCKDDNQVVSNVWKTDDGHQQSSNREAFLRRILLREMEDGATRGPRKDLQSHCDREDTPESQTLVGARRRRAAGSARTNYTAQPNEQPRVTAQDARDDHSARNYVQRSNSWRERQATTSSTPGTTGRAWRWVCGRALRWYRRAWSRASREVDDRHRTHVIDDCDRGRRQNSSCTSGDRTGSSEGHIPGFSRVESVTLHQRGDFEFDRLSGGADYVTLYDVGVSGHPSFIVSGLVLHNCKPEVWNAVRSTLTATRGPVRIIGNVRGTDNWAYELARSAEAGNDPTRHFARLTVYDAVAGGVIHPDEVAEARRDLPEDVFNELYLAQPSKRTRMFSGQPPVVQFTDLPAELLTGIREKTVRAVRSWDIAATAEKPGKDPDWLVGTLLVAWSGKTYVLDVVRDRLAPQEALALFTKTAVSDGVDQVIEQEPGASGKLLVRALESELRREGFTRRVIGATPSGSKETRAFMAAADWSQRPSGFVLVEGAWVADFLDELRYFPHVKHDDQVDALSHGYNSLAGTNYAVGSFRVPGGSARRRTKGVAT